MKLIESVKAVPKTTVINIAKPILSLFAGALVAGSQILGEDSVLTASLVAALPPVCGFAALLGALTTAIFTEITAGKVASLATAMVVLLTRLLFDGTSRRKYPVIASAVATVSYLGCAIFAGVIAGAVFTDYIRIISSGAILAVATCLTTTVSRNGIFSATRSQLLALFALAVVIASSYHLGGILSFIVCVICVYKLARGRDALSAEVRSYSLRLSFLSSALMRFPKFLSPGSGEHSFENVAELLALTESDLGKSLAPRKASPKATRLSEILSKRISAEVTAIPLSDGAVELYLPRSARISENTIIKSAEKAGMGSGCELFRTETDSHIRFTVTQRPDWHFESGVCQIAANSEEQDGGICGDKAEIWSYGVNSYMILSDGMGTGREAGTVAKSLIRAFRNLIEAGYSLESSLRLSSEFIRSCQPEESFATLDILSANLMTGEVTIRKCGAGKSYILRDGCITPVPPGGYPIGILEEISLTSTQIAPTDNLTILMMTDGADSLGIEKLAEIILDSDRLSADDLAALVTSEAYRNKKTGSHDDITVAVIRLSKN